MVKNALTLTLVAEGNMENRYIAQLFITRELEIRKDAWDGGTCSDEQQSYPEDLKSHHVDVWEQKDVFSPDQG